MSLLFLLLKPLLLMLVRRVFKKQMKNQIVKTDFDIAIIGAGAYGFSLAAFIKKIGKKAVHLGGPTQVLFGIKGF